MLQNNSVLSSDVSITNILNPCVKLETGVQFFLASRVKFALHIYSQKYFNCDGLMYFKTF